MQTANEFFIRELGECLDAAQTTLEMLPQQIRECKGEQQVHTTLTNFERGARQQVQNLEGCFQTIGAKPPKIQSYPVRALKQDHDAFLKESPAEALIVLFDLDAMAKGTHYAMASYGGLVEQARLLQQPEVARLLQENLSQEETVDRQIRQLSQQVRGPLIQQTSRSAGARA